MTQTASTAAPRANLPEYTVSELSSALKRRIEESFSYDRVRGEISGFKRHSSGHCYLALKDEDAEVRTRAVWSLGTYARPKETEVIPALQAMLKDTSAGVRCEAIRAVASLESREAGPELKALLPLMGRDRVLARLEGKRA